MSIRVDVSGASLVASDVREVTTPSLWRPGAMIAGVRFVLGVQRKEQFDILGSDSPTVRVVGDARDLRVVSSTVRRSSYRGDEFVDGEYELEMSEPDAKPAFTTVLINALERAVARYHAERYSSFDRHLFLIESTAGEFDELYGSIFKDQAKVSVSWSDADTVAFVARVGAGGFWSQAADKRVTYALALLVERDSGAAQTSPSLNELRFSALEREVLRLTRLLAAAGIDTVAEVPTTDASEGLARAYWQRLDKVDDAAALFAAEVD